MMMGMATQRMQPSGPKVSKSKGNLNHQKMLKQSQQHINYGHGQIMQGHIQSGQPHSPQAIVRASVSPQRANRNSKNYLI